ncbi:MAG TPA: PBP1A family penicillin-binding protein [Bauldia sp.]
MPGKGQKAVRGRAKSKGKAKGRGKSWLRRIRLAALLVGAFGFLGLSGLIAYYASKLPPMADWTVPARAANIRILAQNGTLITNRGGAGGGTVTLDQMPPYLPEAVVSIEDRRFYHHFGIDPLGLVRAAWVNFVAGGVVQGGSTLTQQLAKNLFLQPERTFERKVQEVVLALWLEARLSKKQILELYLNRVYLGAGAYGVDAAAHVYFGKSARALTLAEAATLAGMLKAPSHYSPIINPDASAARAQLVLAAMHQEGYIGDREISLALSADVHPVRDVAGGSGRYVADWVMDLLPGYVGAIDQDITVATSIDLRLQTAADKAVSDTLDADGTKFGVSQGALVAIDRDGAVRALVGGRDYATSPFNRAVNGLRQPGSAFKPFVYLTALEDGLVPETVRVDQPVSIAGWKPQDYSKTYKGPVTLLTALSLSLNTVSAELTQEVGAQAVAATARRLGITSTLSATPSIALGTSEVSPLELTAAYVPFSNGGRGIIPHVIERITTGDGKVLYQRSGSGPGQVIDPKYVGMMNAMLTATVTSGTATHAEVPGWEVAGKTGTSQDFRDAWFIGYTGALTTGVWFGNDDNKPTKKASGGTLPTAAWKKFMTAALDGLQVADLPGHYQYQAPGNMALASAQSAAPPVGDNGRPMALQRGLDPIGAMAQAEDDDPDANLPLPPGAVGQGNNGDYYQPPRRRSFFERLFGG